MTREALIKEIQKYLISYTGSIQSDASKNLLSSSVLAEGFVAWLLNTLNRDWNLVNTNQRISNFRAIDLIDRDHHIAVQVSCSNTPKKVRHTLEQFTAADIPDKDLYQLYIVSITMDKPTDTMLECAEAYPGTVHVWSFDNLYNMITTIPDLTVLETIHAGLQREIVIDPVSIPPFSLGPNSRMGDGFVGRRKKLLDIQAKLNSGMKPVVLNGLGGIGKTELALHFGHGYRANCKGHVFFTTFSNSIRETLISMYASLRDKPAIEKPAPDQMLAAVVNTLGKCKCSDILIVDNVDADQGCLGDLLNDEIYNRLEQMDIRLILTTRFEWDDAIDVDILENEELYQIFHTYSPNLAQTDMDSLIAAVNGHTLTIDLMARMLNGKGIRPVTPQMLLDAFRRDAVREEKYRRIATHYHQNLRQATIYEHLSAVFDMAALSDEAKDILRFATLLPADGMSSVLFADCLSGDMEDVLTDLSEHGWLTANDGLLTIHPVVRLVCRTELNPLDKACTDFLNILWNGCDDDVQDHQKASQIADVFATAANTLTDPDGDWAHHAGYILNQLGDFSTALKFNLEYVSKCELTHSPNLATAYRNTAVSYTNLGQTELSQQYLDLSASCCDINSHYNLALYFHTQSDNLRLQGRAEAALIAANKAMDHWLQMAYPPALPIALTHDSLGAIYCNAGDGQNALEHHLAALDILKPMGKHAGSHLGTCWDNLANAHMLLGNFQQALECLENAKTIYEETLRKNHPDWGILYDNMGAVYARLKQYEQALSCHQEALEVFRANPCNPLDQVYVHCNIANAYQCMEQYDQAINSYQDAQRILVEHDIDHRSLRMGIARQMHQCRQKIQ